MPTDLLVAGEQINAVTIRFVAGLAILYSGNFKQV